MEIEEMIKDVKLKWGNETAWAIVEKIRSYPINWKGALEKSIYFDQEDTLDGDIEFSMANYGKFVDKGVNGTVKNYGAPYNFHAEKVMGVAYYLKEWSTSKGLNQYAVAHNLVKKGIEPRPFFDSVIQARMNDLGISIQDAVQAYMDSQIANYTANKQL